MIHRIWKGIYQYQRLILVVVRLYVTIFHQLMNRIIFFFQMAHVTSGDLSFRLSPNQCYLPADEIEEDDIEIKKLVLGGQARLKEVISPFLRSFKRALPELPPRRENDYSIPTGETASINQVAYRLSGPQEVISRFLRSFKRILPELPPRRERDHSIPTGETVSINQAAYRLSGPQLKELLKQIEDLLKKGLIRDPPSLPLSRMGLSRDFCPETSREMAHMYRLQTTY